MHCSASVKICSLDRDMVCVCGRAAAAGVTHALVCVALWHIVVACQSMMMDTLQRVFARADLTSRLEPHEMQVP